MENGVKRAVAGVSSGCSGVQGRASSEVIIKPAAYEGKKNGFKMGKEIQKEGKIE